MPESEVLRIRGQKSHERGLSPAGRRTWRAAFCIWFDDCEGECLMRSNDAAADALQELADLIAISGGDPYRVRAYEKAARSIAGYPLDLDTLDRKGLIAIPAVGAHTADKLLELRQTGRIAALEDLHAQLPAGLRALLGIPGLGPKGAHQVYVELGISSMPELLTRIFAAGSAGPGFA